MKGARFTDDSGVFVGHFRCFLCFIVKQMSFAPQKRFEVERVVILLFGKTDAGLEI